MPGSGLPAVQSSGPLVLEKLNLERGYGMLCYLGVLLLCPALILAMQAGGVSALAGTTMLFGAGFFFFGLGEWINHPPDREKARDTLWGPGVTRIPCIGGVFLDAVGLALLVLASVIAAWGTWRWCQQLFATGG